MGISEFRGPGLSDKQWEQIESLAVSLDAKQLLWVSGFFAGIEHRAGGAPSGTTVLPQPVETQGRKLTILYGSETGNSTALARDLSARLEKEGRQPRLFDMAAYKTRELKDEEDLLIVTSTYGEGDPPQPAVGFFEFIEGRKAPKLPGLRFAVLSLGDSTYEHYCEAGKRLDRRLEELGGERLSERVDCDVDYDEPAAEWTETVARLFAGDQAMSAAPSASPVAAPAASAFDKRNPFPAPVIDNIVLTGRGSSKETRHLELSLEGSGLAFEPGDALGIVPENDPALVETVLETLGIADAAPIDVKGETVTMGEALQKRFEITALTPRFIEQWGTLADAEALRRLTGTEAAAERTEFMGRHHVVDLLRQYPVKGITAEQFIQALRPLQPRLYSIASSLAAAPDEVHLTVSTVRYELFGEKRSGVASGHIAERGAIDSLIPVYVQASQHFHLPGDDVPIIMVGAGTGVAPYRAFMQEREARGASGRSWLFFGERNFRTDFLYQIEWQEWLKEGVLSRMDVAFSRDRAVSASGGKVYVQTRLKEQAKDVYAWLEEGAHLYVCGDATHMAPDVHAALKTVIADEGGMSAEAAEDYLTRLRDDHRYKLDVY